MKESDSALNNLFEYMTISDIVFYVMSGTGLYDININIVYEEYKSNNDELLRVLVNKFG